MAAVNLAEEVLSGVLQVAEQLQSGVVAAETGAVECLRWAGALPLLLRDLGVQNVVSADALFACATPAELRSLLLPPRPYAAVEPEADDNEAVEHLVVFVTGFLWDYEPLLARVLAMGVVRRLTLCSSLSERAHECYDFEKLRGSSLVPSGAKAAVSMRFDEFASTLSAQGTFPTSSTASSASCSASISVPFAPKTATQQPAAHSEDKDEEEEEWGWTDDAEETPAPVGAVEKPPLLQVKPESTAICVQVLHLPLNYVPLLSSKTFTPEPSVFVLCHPVCASAFPLLLHQALDPAQGNAPSTPMPSAQSAGGIDGQRYSHVKDVQPEHIPSTFRRAMRLLAHTLAELVSGAQLDVKERIFALGATSLKIGHTLLRILNEREEDIGAQALQGHRAASIMIVDRTCDLASPCSFGSSLLDRILALLPQTPATDSVHEARSSATKRTKLHVTEIFPLHGCEPTPLTLTAPAFVGDNTESYQPSEFVAQLAWRGGASLCHPATPNGANVFRSLAFRPAKLALRDLDKRLQAVEHTLLQQGAIQKTAVTRRPGEKTRGRDVVLRRMAKILEAGEPTNIEHSSLIELGVIVLETLERMDKTQQQWDKCRERATRQSQLRSTDAREWIVPELADAVQRQQYAAQSGGTGSQEDFMSLVELLTLLVHAFTLSSGAPMEDFTLEMLRKVLTESVLQAAVVNPPSVQALFPELFEQIYPYVSWKLSESSSDGAATTDREQEEDEGDDWDWDDGSNSPRTQKKPNTTASSSRDGELKLLEAKSTVEAHVERLLGPLKECAQQHVSWSDMESGSSEETPRSLVAHLCSLVVDPTRPSIPELEHVIDASEQLTRAGIDLLKSGFSKIGFGVGSGGSGGQRGASGNRLMGEAQILVVFVVGGITFEEIQEVHDALSDNNRYQIILGGTTITNNEVILEQLFRSSA